MGTTRHSRALTALQPGWLAIDDRGPEQLLAQLPPTAKLFRYFNQRGQRRGTWDAFYVRIPLVRYATLASHDLLTQGRSLRVVLQGLPAAPADPSLLAPAWQQISALLQLYQTVEEEAQHFAAMEGEAPFAQALTGLIADPLRADYHAVLACAAWLAASPCPPPGPVRRLVVTNRTVEPVPPKPVTWDLPPGAAAPAITSPADFVRALTTATWSTHAAFEHLVTAARAAFQQRFAEPRDLPPHFALYLAFIRQFAGVQAVLNTLPTRHRDHFYREVLGLAPKPAQPDRVHVAFEAAAPSPVELPAGTRLIGADAAGQAVVYATASPVRVAGHRIAEMVTTWLLRPAGTPAKLYVAPRAASADGRGAPLPPGAAWPSVGEDQAGLSAGRRTMLDGYVGFAFTSPVLHLEGGNREVTARIRFSDQPEPAMAGTAKVAPPAPLPSERSLTHWQVEIDYTGPEGWVAVARNRIAGRLLFRTGSEGQIVPLGLEILVFIADGAPASVNHDPLRHGPGFDPRTPTWRIRFRDPAAVFSGSVPSDVALAETFAQLPVAAIDLQARVERLRDVSAIGPSGPLPAGKTVPLFGSPPVAGGRVAIGAPELFRKRLTDLQLEVVWEGLPTDRVRFPLGLRSYYETYLPAVTNPRPDMFCNDRYRAAFAVLQEGRWIALPNENPYLFDWPRGTPSFPLPNGPLLARSHWRWRSENAPILPVQPELPAAPVPPGTAVQGYLALTLSGPDYLFGHALYPAAVAAVVTENAVTAVQAAEDAGDEDQAASAFNLLKQRVFYSRLVPAKVMRPVYRLRQDIFAKLDADPPMPPVLERALAAIKSYPAQFRPRLRSLDQSRFRDEATMRTAFARALALSEKQPLEMVVCDEVIHWLAAMFVPSRQQPPPPPIPHQRPLPPPPLTPTVRELHVGYTATATIDCRSVPAPDAPAWDRAWRLDPLAPAPLPLWRQPLATEMPAGGCLYLGIANARALETISLLFVLEPAASAAGVPKDVPRWACLVRDEWHEIDQRHGVRDGTAGLLRSGIVSITLPYDVGTSHQRMADGVVWLRLQVDEPAPRLRVKQILPHAVEAAWVMPADPAVIDAHFRAPLPPAQLTGLEVAVPGVQGLEQPLPSFGGTARESDDAFTTRVSERLRHKGRAVAARDYERLLLQEFPALFAVRALRPDSLRNAGRVDIIVLPSLSPEAVPPALGFTAGELQEMQVWLTARCPMSAVLEVMNPHYEPIEVSVTVRFAPGTSFDRGRELLNRDLRRLISPWIYAPDEAVDPAPALPVSAVRAFIRERPYVDDIGLCLAYRPVYGPPWPLDTIVASSLRAQIVSAPEHRITALVP